MLKVMSQLIAHSIFSLEFKSEVHSKKMPGQVTMAGYLNYVDNLTAYIGQAKLIHSLSSPPTCVFRNRAKFS